MLVIAREIIARDVVELTLAAKDNAQLPSWQPGSHLEVRLPSGSLRHYSLCGSPTDGRSYRIAVLREDLGRGGSQEVHRELRVGTTLHARPPRNHFALVPADAYLMLAGGIGITPLKTMVEQLHGTGREWTLVYGGRTAESMAYLDRLKRLDASRVTVVAQDVDGLIDLAGVIGSAASGTHIYCCGPGAMLTAVEAECKKQGKAGQLHVERFSVDGAVAPVVERGGAADKEFDVELMQTGVTVHVAAGETILDAVRRVRDDVDYSCMEGYCGTCETAVLSGRPDHRGSFMSSEEHDAEGTMLICVGRALSEELVLDV